MGAGAGIAAEIRRNLGTGEHDMLFRAWTGENTLDRLNRGHEAMVEALVAEVKRRAADPETPAGVAGLDLVSFAQTKAEPMVRGLFPKAEQETMLGLVERSVVFLTSDSVGSVLRDCKWLSTAWKLANMYLMSVNAKPLGQDAANMVGLSEELTCYLSLDYFRQEHPFADFVVHEIAHVFHNVRWQSIGLRETRTRKYPLSIDFRKRETFAYSCEAYSQILERASKPAERRALAQQFDGFNVDDDRVDSSEVASVVRCACERRNGWKVILAHCAPPK